MSVESHLASLEKRHFDLGREIEIESIRPSTDDARLADLKRRKLRVKDEIERVRKAALTSH